MRDAIQVPHRRGLNSRFQRLVWLCLAMQTGCGGDNQDPTPTPDPLAVTAVSPADAATTAETGALVTATFNRAVDPASLTAGSFPLTAGGTPLSTRLEYDGATRTARVVAPLLPGTLYQTQVTTAVTDAEGGPLSAAEAWSFTTRDWEPVVVDTLAGPSTSLEVDGLGRLHLSYRDATNGDLRYATCEAACTVADNWTSVAVDQVEDVGLYSSLVIDPAGALHITYYAVTANDLKYAACAADCTTAANWTAIAVDQTGSVGWWGSLAVDGSGRLHAAYYDLTNGVLKYAGCTAACTTPANWTTVPVDVTGGGGYTASIAVDGTGRLHVGYHSFDNVELRYATCGAACTTAANWTAIGVSGPVGGQYASLAVDGDGAVHMTYLHGPDGDLVYTTCTAAQCTSGANWTTVPVDQGGEVGTYSSLAVDGSGRLHVSYLDGTNDDLKYATCAAACTTAASWQAATVDQAGMVGALSSLAVDGLGRLHVSYLDLTAGTLKYIE